MITRIYVSNKIQKCYKKLVLNPLPEKSDMLSHQNSWNANYLPMFGRKCWILTHTLTRYTVIVPDVKAKDLDRFVSMVREHMINQLVKKQLINPDKVNAFIGELEFYPTNNDKSCIAYNNQRQQDLNYWKYEFDTFDEIPFSKIGSNVNELGSILRNGESVYIEPSKEFLNLIMR
jgi:hypothetical protein